ncbi:hypothetical protein PR003_g23493 [Phytophthora rubi]|uniref:Uncharacterized protein n=1 Tax=Phytophthora rubi TaxID=129364 RepID=A0A6A3J5D7_9STRA|nr:hypothetical protein PR002_g22678 [Phytophthora rubi]KAE8987434.1 hypothetical protein PR001_g22328 [Phytophthora rubi]KAE9297450.1 hypothetical protein PR003_g23493 [Phytophthora rubi]
MDVTNTTVVPVVPEIPRQVIAAMVAAEAQKKEVEGEDLRIIIRIDGVDSPAWDVYKTWVLSLGEDAAADRG